MRRPEPGPELGRLRRRRSRRKRPAGRPPPSLAASTATLLAQCRPTAARRWFGARPHRPGPAAAARRQADPAQGGLQERRRPSRLPVVPTATGRSPHGDRSCVRDSPTRAGGSSRRAGLSRSAVRVQAPAPAVVRAEAASLPLCPLRCPVNKDPDSVRKTRCRREQ